MMAANPSPYYREETYRYPSASTDLALGHPFSALGTGPIASTSTSVLTLGNIISSEGTDGLAGGNGGIGVSEVETGAGNVGGEIRHCSVKGCGNTLPQDTDNKMCESCRSRHRQYANTKRAKRKAEKAAVALHGLEELRYNVSHPQPQAHTTSTPSTSTDVSQTSVWLPESTAADGRVMPELILMGSSRQGAKKPGEVEAPTPAWDPSALDPRLFTSKSSELAGALSFPTRSPQAQAQPQPTASPPQPTSTQSDQSTSADADLPSKTPSTSKLVPHTAEELAASSTPPRYCSVKGCKALIPGDYFFKMCEPCRERYKGYGITKRAKWKQDRLAANAEWDSLRDQEDARRASLGIPLLGESGLEEVKEWEKRILDEVNLEPRVREAGESAESMTLPTRMCTVSHCHKLLPGTYKFRRCEQHRLQNRYHSKLKRVREKEEKAKGPGEGAGGWTEPKEAGEEGPDEGAESEIPLLISEAPLDRTVQSDEAIDRQPEASSSKVTTLPPAARGIRRTNHVCSVKSCCNLLAPDVPWKMCDTCRKRDREVRKTKREEGALVFVNSEYLSNQEEENGGEIELLGDFVHDKDMEVHRPTNEAVFVDLAPDMPEPVETSPAASSSGEAHEVFSDLLVPTAEAESPLLPNIPIQNPFPNAIPALPLDIAPSTLPIPTAQQTPTTTDVQASSSVLDVPMFRGRSSALSLLQSVVDKISGPPTFTFVDESATASDPPVSANSKGKDGERPAKRRKTSKAKAKDKAKDTSSPSSSSVSTESDPPPGPVTIGLPPGMPPSGEATTSSFMAPYGSFQPGYGHGQWPFYMPYGMGMPPFIPSSISGEGSSTVPTIGGPLPGMTFPQFFPPMGQVGDTPFPFGFPAYLPPRMPMGMGTPYAQGAAQSDSRAPTTVPTPRESPSAVSSQETPQVSQSETHEGYPVEGRKASKDKEKNKPAVVTSDSFRVYEAVVNDKGETSLEPTGAAPRRLTKPRLKAVENWEELVALRRAEWEASRTASSAASGSSMSSKEAPSLGGKGKNKDMSTFESPDDSSLESEDPQSRLPTPTPEVETSIVSISMEGRPCATRTCHRTIAPSAAGVLCEKCKQRLRKRQEKVKQRFRLEPKVVPLARPSAGSPRDPIAEHERESSLA